jgi:hypothetical protein
MARCSNSQPGKQNVPPFRGGTWQAFYADGDKCQPASPLQSADVKISNLRKIPVQWKTQIAILI